MQHCPKSLKKYFERKIKFEQNTFFLSFWFDCASNQSESLNNKFETKFKKYAQTWRTLYNTPMKTMIMMTLMMMMLTMMVMANGNDEDDDDDENQIIAPWSRPPHFGRWTPLHLTPASSSSSSSLMSSSSF